MEIGSPFSFVSVQSQAPVQIQGKAQAPQPAFNLRQAFDFETYGLAQRQAARAD
jgi:hypothetical protein